MSSRLADGSGGGRHSYEPSCVRALDSYMTLQQQASRVCDELDYITVPGVVISSMGPDDSLVIALQEFVSSCEQSGTGKSEDDTGKKS